MMIWGKAAWIVLGAALAVASVSAADWQPEKVTVQQVKNELGKMSRQHPRLFLGQDGLKKLAENRKKPDGKALADRILYDADLMLGYQPLDRQMVGRRMLETSRKVLYRINTLGMAYLLTSDAKYAKRGIAEMMHVAAYSDWNPAHFLDVGEMTLAMATGYDWFYPVMTPEERKVVADAIWTKGINTSYQGKHWWIAGNNNWTQVCHAGLVAGALATYEDKPEEAAKVIARAVVNLPRVMKVSYAPEGAYPEGPGYWVYGTEFNVVLLGLLDAAFGHDFNLSKQPGFDKTGEFMVAMVGPTGMAYSFADCGTGNGIDVARLWWVWRFNRPDCFSVHDRGNFNKKVAERPKSVERWGNRLLPLAMLYLAELPPQGTRDLPQSYYSGKNAIVPLAVHRSGSGPRDSYLGIKGGRVATNHGHMDIGSFLFEADGVRWAVDLGADDYTKMEKAGVDLWNMGQKSGRWSVFRLGPKIHNILMIDDQPQAVKDFAPIVEHRDAKNGQYSVVDLTAVYKGQLRKALRKAQLLPDGSAVITDTLEGLKPGAKVRWQMCTQSEIAGVAGQNVKLEKGRETLTLEAVSPVSARWSVTPTASLEGPLDAVNRNARMVWFEAVAPPDGKLRLEVRLVPGSVRK